MLRKLSTICLLLVFLFFACAAPNTPPPPASDNDEASFSTNAQAPVDPLIYTIVGIVTEDVDGLVWQVAPAERYVSGYSYDGYGSMSGRYTGPVIDGKTFLTLKVASIEPTDGYYKPDKVVGAVLVVKAADTKAQALLVGTTVTLKCRNQYEAVAPITQQETFDADKYATWELDYCRLYEPITIIEEGAE